MMKPFLYLHILLMVYSLSGICSKMAAGQPFLSPRFCLFYALIIIILGIYAVGWQQVIKRLPLSTAFANKAVTVIWGLIWGVLFFGEKVTLGKCVGILFVICGIVVFALSDRNDNGKAGDADEK